ncbi:outer membrane lipoprotein carrier protein LolA [Plasticicumulans acidivorans]|uniref:Outer membrane lipoprotein-sorting protein n=1 Tax=Plasticicumulans acidivorans TaxID=886464 RepID=A0A317MXZ3_9GAMM|nr:outer membrane lipoprotein carrier protein LolA [Plasticicumulans acidivorans]PWV64569.1 outer membrane lipoprotein-sorting protein [Plasticicumulans acidivorans]
MRRRLLSALLLTVAALAHAEDWTLTQLMAALAANPGGRAHFVERKDIALLDAPVEARGELFYRPPDHLERRTQTPQPETLILDGEMLTLERDGRRLQLSLAERPQIAAFTDSIRRTLAGDRHALERAYRLTLSGEAALWTLRLVPDDEALREIIQQITISGNQGEVRSIAILQADGDRSLMTITPEPAP